MKSRSPGSEDSESSEKSQSIYPPQDSPDLFGLHGFAKSFQSEEYPIQSPTGHKSDIVSKALRALHQRKKDEKKKNLRLTEAKQSSEGTVSQRSKEARLVRDSTKSEAEKVSGAGGLNAKAETERFPFGGLTDLCSLEDFAFVEKPTKAAFSVQDLIKEPVKLNLEQALRRAPFTTANLDNAQKLPNLPRLFALTLKLFTGGEIVAEDLDLTDYEESIFNDILKRKFDKNFKKKELSLDPARRIEILRKISSRKPQKRPEECYKFIFTRVFKYLKSRFRAEHEAGDNPEKDFYSHYFGDVATLEAINLEAFFYRAAVKSRTNLNLSLGSHYFEIVLKSPLFLQEMLRYISGPFRDDLRGEIERKIKLLVEKWDKDLNIKSNKQAFKYMEIKNYITKDRHCKLPWTFFEAEEAVRKVYNLVNNYTSQKLKELPI